MRERKRREKKKTPQMLRQSERVSLSEQNVATKKRVKGKCNVAQGCV